MADAPQDEEAEWNEVINTLWAEFDKDQSGYLDKSEILPLVQAALA